LRWEKMTQLIAPAIRAKEKDTWSGGKKKKGTYERSRKENHDRGGDAAAFTKNQERTVKGW